MVPREQWHLAGLRSDEPVALDRAKCREAVRREQWDGLDIQAQAKLQVVVHQGLWGELGNPAHRR
jgi:hypothetical protein